MTLPIVSERLVIRRYAHDDTPDVLGFASDPSGLHRIHVDTSTDNTASWRMMERLGMRREGLLRGAVYEEGRWVDRCVYGMLTDEWLAAGVSE